MLCCSALVPLSYNCTTCQSRRDMCRHDGAVHHLVLECPPPLRHSAAGHGHGAEVAWPSHTRLVPLRNAVELLGPKLDFFLRGAAAQLRGRYTMAVAGNAIVLQDACVGGKIHIKPSNKNADLCTSFEECAATSAGCVSCCRSVHKHMMRMDAHECADASGQLLLLHHCKLR